MQVVLSEKGELNKKIKKDFKSRQKLSTLSFIVHLTMRRVLVFDTRTRARVYARGYFEIFVIKRVEKGLAEKFFKVFKLFLLQAVDFLAKVYL